MLDVSRVFIDIFGRNGPSISNSFPLYNEPLERQSPPSPVGVQWNQCGVSNVSDMPLNHRVPVNVNVFAAVDDHLADLPRRIIALARHSFV